MTVVPFKKSADPHLAGEAKCLACGNKWVAVAPVGTCALECPACGTWKGAFMAFCRPDNGDIWVCKCGSDLFYFTRSGGFCASCAAPQVFP